MANRWTEEQRYAIDVEGCNVLVSAGAGSGKTAVLSERVLRKVKSGTHINEMLILTFTKAAAKEMRDRIRDKFIENHLQEEIALLDSSYITTFDSYSLSVVKKYHSVLNVDAAISISDGPLLDILKRDVLENIIEEYYKEGGPAFKNFVCHFSLKDDKDLLDLIIKISNKLDLKYDRREFLENYIATFYSEEQIDALVCEYESLVLEEKSLFDSYALQLKEVLEDKKLANFIEKVDPFLRCNQYDSIREKIEELTLPRANGYSEEAKEVNDKLKASKETLSKFCIYESLASIKKEIMDTYEDSKILVEILLKLDREMHFKKEKEGLYDFNDISHLAIKLVRENEKVRCEIKNSFKEILIDEYQDTSDNQELFISLISNDNVYAVGDIKQSIYRFRNANPYIFKNKYDTYSLEQAKGVKIDLNKNFRSREEVLSNINLLFESIMDDKIGGANYRESHQAVFGNTSYNEEGKTEQNYNLEVYTYGKSLNLTNVEREIFIIAEDIKEKMASKYQIFDKDKKVLRDVCYDDFVILLDKKRDFDLYKKIFEYLNIPLTLLKEESIHNTDDFLIIHSLFKLLLKVYEKDFGIEFKYSFTSLARSFLFSYSDNEIFRIFSENAFLETDIVKIAFEICKKIEVLPLKDLFLYVLDQYHYLDMVLTTTDILNKENVVEYLNDFISSFANGDIYDFMYYLDNVVEREYDIKYDNSVLTPNTVKIMSIHKSKGLEFPICYFADLESRFNKSDQKEKVVFDCKYGLILPSVDEESKDTICKLLFKKFDTIEEVGERIRLFYVALTRCKEKLIIVCPEVEEDTSIYEEIVDYRKREKYLSFYSILKSIWYKLEPYIKKIEDKEYTKDYLYKIKNSALICDTQDKIEVCEEEFVVQQIENHHYSKSSYELLTKEDYLKLAFGTQIHEILEETNFKYPNFESIEDPFIRNKVRKFVENDIIQKNLDGQFYKEYEFIYDKDNKHLHGVIDFMIEKDDSIIIVDYKLKNILDDNYIKQLSGYKDYIESITNKKVELYLYSILDEELKGI